MENKIIAWGTGSGNITLIYTGQGNAAVSVSTDVNEGIDREQSILVETTHGEPKDSESVLIRQPGLREVFSVSDGTFLLKNGGTFNVLK